MMTERQTKPDRGARVRVYSVSLNLMPSDEGEALVLEPLEENGLYLVQFDDGEVAERYVR